MIQHKLDLFATGFEYNAGAGISLADSREALLRYRSSLDTLRPIGERTVESRRAYGADSASTVGGVCAIVKEDSVRLFTLGSSSRGIPYNEWEIPTPVINPWYSCFYPGADVIAFLDLQEMRYVGLS